MNHHCSIGSSALHDAPKGTSVPKDDQQAYFWYLLASVDGDKDSSKNRDIVEAKLTPQQRATAQAQARDWKPRKQ